MAWFHYDADTEKELIDFITDKEYECMSFSEALIKKKNDSAGNYLSLKKNDDILIHRNTESNLIDFSIMLNTKGQLLIAAGSGIDKDYSINLKEGVKLLGSRRTIINTLMGKSSAVNLIIKTCFPEMDLVQGMSSFDYYIMTLQKKDFIVSKNTSGAFFRKPGPDDYKNLLPLQEYYEKEEVLPCPEMYSSHITSITLKKIMAEETLYLAEFRGRIAAKANTNSTGFCHVQIGGVYTLPEFRNLGISTEIVSMLSAGILDSGKTPSLFVKKRNPAAIRVYEKTGYRIAGEFKIAYGNPC